jgi:hypothetical protein
MIITTDKIEKYGPWFITRKAMEALDELFDEIRKDIIEIRKGEIQILAEKEIEYSYNKGKTIEQLQEEISIKELKDYYTRLILGLSDKTSIVTDSIKNAIKNLVMQNKRVKYLEYKIKIGMKEIELEIDSSYGCSLKYKSSYIDEELKSKIFYKIENCLDDYKPNSAAQFWNHFRFPISWLFQITFWVIFIIRLINGSSSYKSVIKSDMRKIIDMKDITQEQINQLVIFIAKIQSDYQPKTFITNPNGILFYVYLFLPIIGLILLFAPKTTIEYGKSARSIILWKTWMYFILIFLPSSIIVPVILSLLIK